MFNVNASTTYLELTGHRKCVKVRGASLPVQIVPDVQTDQVVRKIGRKTRWPSWRLSLASLPF